jgi:hypothetical protein
MIKKIITQAFLVLAIAAQDEKVDTEVDADVAKMMK